MQNPMSHSPSPQYPHCPRTRPVRTPSARSGATPSRYRKCTRSPARTGTALVPECRGRVQGCLRAARTGRSYPAGRGCRLSHHRAERKPEDSRRLPCTGPFRPGTTRCNRRCHGRANRGHWQATRIHTQPNRRCDCPGSRLVPVPRNYTRRHRPVHPLACRHPAHHPKSMHGGGRQGRGSGILQGALVTNSSIHLPFGFQVPTARLPLH